MPIWVGARPKDWLETDRGGKQLWAPFAPMGKRGLDDKTILLSNLTFKSQTAIFCSGQILTEQ